MLYGCQVVRFVYETLCQARDLRYLGITWRGRLLQQKAAVLVSLAGGGASLTVTSLPPAPPASRLLFKWDRTTWDYALRFSHYLLSPSFSSFLVPFSISHYIYSNDVHILVSSIPYFLFCLSFLLQITFPLHLLAFSLFLYCNILRPDSSPALTYILFTLALYSFGSFCAVIMSYFAPAWRTKDVANND